ncbi:MAG: SusC/RagA family TonB-linked outer membrane protein [Pseudobacter sp.]|uniref:SusC/RagA family TonB-linked outer membrane protein n=1 Tax=Pseudobacter sp. TaxID=2045420 RepID=UPI003F7CF316
MRMLTVFLFIGSLAVSAKPVAQTVSIKAQDISLKEVFSAVKKQTGYFVFFNEDLLKNAKPVSVDVNAMPLNDFFNMILKEEGLGFRIAGKSVFLYRRLLIADASSLHDKATPIRIRVLDSTGRGLSGASVAIKGKKTSGVTGADGSLTINVNEGDVLQVSFVGYETRTINITSAQLSGGNDLSITLIPSVTKLDDVVVVVNTGYQKMARERSAGSVAKPNTQMMQERSFSMNVIQRLDGLVPGLTINNAPGANSILIRGLTTLGGQRNPLFVVNGIPLDDVNTLNPTDVEDITVLKDATAASIWGARAANGVIVITTKKGKESDKIRMDYDFFNSFQGKPDIGYIKSLRSKEFIPAAREIFDPVQYVWANVSTPVSTTYGGYGRATVAPHELILYNLSNGLINQAQADEQLNALAAYDNLDEIKNTWYRNASLMNHTLSFTGGGKKYNFYGSASYTNTQNSTPTNKDESYAVNLRQDYTFSNRIQAYLITDLRNSVAGNGLTISPTASYLPYVSFKNPDGSNASLGWMYRTDALRNTYQNQSLINLDYVPLDEMNRGQVKDNTLYARLTSGITMKLIKGLRYEGIFSYTKARRKNTNLMDEKSYPVREELVAFTVASTTPEGQPAYYLPNSGGKLTTINADQRNYTVRNQLIYDNEWMNGTHQLTVLAGQEAQEQFTNTNTSLVWGYNPQLLTYGRVDFNLLSKTTTLSRTNPGPGVVYYGNPVYTSSALSYSMLDQRPYTEAEQTTRFTSYFANAGYTYNRKYTVNASWRADQSNLFGKDRSAQNRPVWSAGLAWALSREDFMQDITWLDRLSLRVTHGIAGNPPTPSSAASFDIFSQVNASLYPGGTGLSLTTPGNAKLSWETTKTTNLGIDFAVLKNRISGSIDLYNKNTSNLIGYMTLNPLGGFTSITGNVGDMNNKGIEFAINTLNVTTKKFSWRSQLNLAYNKNKITKLSVLGAGGGAITTTIDYLGQRYLQGYSAFNIFAYRYAGLDNMGDPQIYQADGKVTKARDVSTIPDLKYMGTFQPVWSGGISNIFSYGNFTLGFNAVYNFGNAMRKDINSTYAAFRAAPTPGVFTAGNIHSDFQNRWKQPGDEAFTDIPSYVPNSTTSSTRRNLFYYTYADVNVVSAAYVKLRDVTFSYALPASLLQRVKVAGITLRAQLSNIMLWKANHEGIDPEFQNAAATGNNRTTPFNQHSFTVGAHVTL